MAKLSQAERIRLAAIVERQKFTLARWGSRKLKQALAAMSKATSEAMGQGGLDRALLVVDEFQSEIREVLEDIYERTGETFAEGTAKRVAPYLPEGAIVRGQIDDALDVIGTRYARQALTQSKLINETNKEIIRRVTRQLVEQGFSEVEIGAKIRSYQDDINVARSQMIARTEVHMVAEETQAAIVEELPLPPMIKEWNASLDRRTRKDHRRADGQQRDKDGLFDVGGEKMKYPGDRSGGPAQICNCRCTTLYLPADEASEVGNQFDATAAPLTPGGFTGDGSDFGADQ